MSYPDKRRLFFYGIHRSLSAPGNAPEKEYEKKKSFPFHIPTCHEILFRMKKKTGCIYS